MKCLCFKYTCDDKLKQIEAVSIQWVKFQDPDVENLFFNEFVEKSTSQSSH